MDPINDIVTLDITPSPAAFTAAASLPSVADDLLCFKCHKSNAKLMRFECHCDLPVHVECAIYLKRKGYTCPFCHFTKDMRQVTPESRLLPRNELVTRASCCCCPCSSSQTFNIYIIGVIVLLACILAFVIYNYAISQ